MGDSKFEIGTPDCGRRCCSGLWLYADRVRSVRQSVAVNGGGHLHPSSSSPEGTHPTYLQAKLGRLRLSPSSCGARQTPEQGSEECGQSHASAKANENNQGAVVGSRVVGVKETWCEVMCIPCAGCSGT